MMLRFLPFAQEHVQHIKLMFDLSEDGRKALVEHKDIRGYTLFEEDVVLGIGGSGLGTVVIRDALLGPYWNDGSDEDREHFPRLHVVDNPDPFTFHGLLDRLDPARTLFNVVSKSGTTALSVCGQEPVSLRCRASAIASTGRSIRCVGRFVRMLRLRPHCCSTKGRPVE